MLYRFAWVMMWITFKIFFRRIDLVGLEKLKSGKPAIIIANHPASFLDAMVMAVFLRRSIHFYVRGDIFAHPIAYKLLTMLHMIPIFSREHGTHNLSKNKRTFDRGRKLLEEGNLLLIFPEGFSRQSKQLEPFKKGAARVALQTAFEGGKIKDLQIQTVALNYSYHHLGANLLIRLGDTMTLEHYEQQYNDFPAMAVTQLNKEMSAVFQQNVIHVQDGERTEVVEALIRMRYHDKDIKSNELFNECRKICNKVDQLSQHQFCELKQTLVNYEQVLIKQNISDQSVVNLQCHSTSFDSWKVYCLMPLAILGKLIWWLPGRASIWIANKTVTRIDFYTSVLSGILGFMGFIWWLMFCVFGYNRFGNIGLAIGLISPVFSFIYMQWNILQQNHFALLRIKRINKRQYKVIEELISQRRYLLAIGS
jgi:1-acyl-sn-glycerol-3-phosphate acyltransferase